MLDKKDIAKLVKLYFEYNPQNNKGIGWRAKANDIISSYANTHGMTFEEIKDCIEKSPICQKPIWTQFYEYYGNMKKLNKKSNYKDSVSDSTDVNDWM
jgi:hypothetical protein